MPATTGMKGAGYYDEHSSTQLSSIRTLQGWLDHAAANMPLPEVNGAVTVLDLGSSEGRNAIQVMASVVQIVRRRTHRPVWTFYSDLASNNFNQLFVNLSKSTDRFPADVYSAAAGGSFYGPLLPPASVNLATSFNAILWLDHLPAVPIPDFVVYHRPQPRRTAPGASPLATVAFRRQADQDLVRFLECRARELIPGGKLLLATPGDTDEVRVCDGLFDLLNDACLDLVASGRLMRASYERLTMPCYYRTVDELLTPLERFDSPVRGAFSVDRAEALEVPIPYIDEFRRSGDVQAFAAAYTGFLRAISEPVVRAVVNEPEGEVIVEGLYDRVRVRLVTEPERYFWRYMIAAMLLTRC
jgi:hypothetical protein